MKSLVVKGVLATAIVLPALSGMAWAGGLNDHFVCSNATLQGDYAFSIVQFSAPPSVVVGLGTFDGKGGFKQIDYPGNGLTDSNLTGFRMGQTGSYTINSDCTGFQEIFLNVGGTGAGHGVIENALVISNGGRSIRGVVSAFTPPGGSTPETPLQTRVDFWKAAPEQDD